MEESILERDLSRDDVIACLREIGIKEGTKSWEDYEFAKKYLIQWDDKIARWVAEWVGV